MTVIWEPRVSRRDLENAGKRIKEFIGDLEHGIEHGIHVELGSFIPRVDAWESEEGFHAVAELAGVKQEDVKLKIGDDILTLQGEKKRDYSAPQMAARRGDTNVARSERTFGEFKKMLPLPAGLDDERATANFNDGVLTVFIPRSAPAKPREREVPIGR